MLSLCIQLIILLFLRGSVGICENRYLWYSINSEAFASEFLEILVELFHWFHMYNVVYRGLCSNTLYCVTLMNKVITLIL